MEPKTITIPKINSLTLEYSLLASALFIPMVISGPQLLTGTIVNALLFLFISQTHSKKALPLILLPSIGALINGLVFGTSTLFLLYFLPFIWLANYFLTESFRYFLQKYSYLISAGLSSVIKCAVLFCSAYLLTSTGVVPVQFLQLMGLFQLYTALLGGVIAYGVYTILKKTV